MNDYHNIVSAVFGTVWDIQPHVLDAIAEVVSLRVNGHRLTDQEIEERIGGRRPTRAKDVKGDVAVIPFHGVSAHRMNMMTDISGGVSTEQFGKEFDKLASDESIGAIVIDFHSPGGLHAGGEELSDKIFNARNPKRPIIAMVNDLTASLAFWIATAADEIVVTPGGQIGSVGTLLVHREDSEAQKSEGVKTTIIHAGKFKTEGNPDEPLGDEAKAELQRIVDLAHGEFVDGVARNRGTTSAIVRDTFGQGRVFGGKDAIKRGMADRIGTLDQVLERLGVSKKVESGVRSEVDPDIDLRRRRAHIRERSAKINLTNAKSG